MQKNKQKNLKILITYYGLLQSLHLIALIRAGVLMLSGTPSPFPLLPPPDGWQAQTLPFLFGLGGTDVVGIILGILFAYWAVVKGNYQRLTGLISLTIFITGAIVFGAGTFPSGAWAAHPIAYWSMVILFIPAPILYILMLKQKDITQAYTTQK